MKEYGFINKEGYLEIKMLDPSSQVQVDAASANGWKPIDPPDKEKGVASSKFTNMNSIPYDNGDRISFRYEEYTDTLIVGQEIETLKAELASSDYRVLKSYEASLVRKSSPYDMLALHDEREALREKIRELEQLIENEG